MRVLKVFLILAVALIAVMGASSVAYLASASKSEAVTISTSASNNTTELTATTLKHGSDYQVTWTVVEPSGNRFPAAITDNGTLLNSDGYYVSKATFSPQGLSGGNYIISYQITMRAGTSTVTWVSGGTAVVTVPGAVTKPVYEWIR